VLEGGAENDGAGVIGLSEGVGVGGPYVGAGAGAEGNTLGGAPQHPPLEIGAAGGYATLVTGAAQLFEQIIRYVV
jgi:hypothetical protein